MLSLRANPARSAKGSQKMNHESPVHATQRLVEALIAARQTARVRLHLLSLDARDQWQELEAQLDCLQSRIEYEGARIRPGAADKVREVIESVTEFLRQHRVLDVRDCAADPASDTLPSGPTPVKPPVSTASNRVADLGARVRAPVGRPRPVRAARAAGAGSTS